MPPIDTQEMMLFFLLFGVPSFIKWLCGFAITILISGIIIRALASRIFGLQWSNRYTLLLTAKTYFTSLISFELVYRVFFEMYMWQYGQGEIARLLLFLAFCIPFSWFFLGRIDDFKKDSKLHWRFVLTMSGVFLIIGFLTVPAFSLLVTWLSSYTDFSVSI